MGKLTEEQIQKIYHNAKSPQEIRTEQQIRMLARIPSYVPLKVGLWIMLCTIVNIGYYQLITRVISKNIMQMSSMGDVLFGVAFPIVAMLVFVAFFWFVYSEIMHLVAKFRVATSVLTTIVIAILASSFSLFIFTESHYAIIAYICTPLASFIATYGVMKLVVRSK